MNKTPQEQAQEKIEDIKNNPTKHRHDFGALQMCCMVNGALDTRVMEAHETYSQLGMNGGQRCDVTDGPCSCGAWH
jgi:hypothetical protein